MTDYVGFANQETFNLTVALDTDGGLQDHIGHFMYERSVKPDAENLQEAVADYLEPRGNGYGRHALMDVIETVRLVGSLWRVDWAEVAEYLNKESVL